jgi:hypothetical protein
MSSPTYLLNQAANRVGGGRDAAARLPTPGESLVWRAVWRFRSPASITSDGSGLRLITSGRSTIRA